MSKTKIVGRRIRALRMGKGVSCRQLSKDAKVSPATLSRIERSETPCSVDTLLLIALALDASIQELVDGL